MASNLKLKNNINSELIIEHSNDTPARTISGGDFVIAVDTVADMESLINLYTGMPVFVRDMVRGGNFVYDATLVGSDNSGTNFKGFIRQYSGVISSVWFDSEADAIAFAIQNKEVINDYSVDVEITVGSSGDFLTINEAIVQAERMKPTLVKDGATGGATSMNIRLLSGFVMQEQLIIIGKDLGWMRISGDDAETTIQRDTLTEGVVDDVSTRYPAFCADTNATLPIIDQLFNMNSSGDVLERSGILIKHNSSVTVRDNAGVKNAGYYGILCLYSSNSSISNTIFSGALQDGIYASDSSTINARNAIVTNCGVNGIHANNTSAISAMSADVSGSIVNGVYSSDSSKIEAESINASNCYTSILAIGASTINARNAIATNTSFNSIIAKGCSVINAFATNCSTDGDPIEEYAVTDGGTINISGATGEVDTNIALNTITSSGIIYG